ncbi:MAG: DMT family transporter [Xanthobacteraceae bacterium]|nr:DMT family transporter [Xanthobacteraceae bacterium]
MTTPAEQRRQRLIGIALMCGAVAMFSCLDTTAKYLLDHMDTLQVVWARYFSAFVLSVILFNPFTRPGVLRTTRPVLQVGRSALLLASTTVSFFALIYLQLDQALAILFSTPFIVAALSVPLLGEKVGARRWAAICVGFLGVLLVTRPGFGGIHPAAILSVISAFCYALYNIATRAVSRTDSSETSLFYTNLVGAAAMLPVLPFVWTLPKDPFIVLLMVVVGAFGALGHYLLIIAHRLAPPALLAPFIYTQLVWTGLLGFLVFADVPNQWTLAGAAIVTASGLYILYRERKVTGEAKAPVVE